MTWACPHPLHHRAEAPTSTPAGRTQWALAKAPFPDGHDRAVSRPNLGGGTGAACVVAEEEHTWRGRRASGQGT